MCNSALRANLLRWIVTATIIRGISVCSKSKHTGGGGEVEACVTVLSERGPTTGAMGHGDLQPAVTSDQQNCDHHHVR